jgi:MoaA/NifB/PqqE/SkfB family radical SAM enzyme
MKIDVDNHKLMYHPKRVAEWLENGDCAPIYVEVGPTNRCNHKCMFCALDWLEHGGADINSEILIKNLEDMAKFGVKSIMFAGEGEPFLHKDIVSFVQTAKKNGIDVAITSNGIPFTKEKADKTLPYLSWIRFSVDAGTPETYAEIHGTKKEDFSRLVNNLKYAVEIKRKNNLSAVIGVQALLTNKSINEIKSLAELVKEIGVDNIQIKPYSHHPASKNDLRFDFAQAERIREEIESLNDENFQVAYRTQTIKRLQNNRCYEQCHGLPFFSLLDAHGNVIPCNLFYNNPEFYYGNINNQLFSEIWTGERRKEIIQKIKNKGIDECRAGCRLDAINRYLEELKNLGGHNKFI